MHILPVLLAGGSGSRLAPLSTPLRPKPFLPFDAQGRSLYEKTLMRVQHPAFLAPLIIGAQAMRFAMANLAYDAIHPQLPAILLEHTPQGTAYAIAYAVLFSQIQLQHTPDTLLAIMPCDHLICDDARFTQTLLALGNHLQQQPDRLGLLGIATTNPNREFGYFHCGEPRASTQAMPVTTFKEKPENAEDYTYAQGWLANSGIFLARIDTLARMLQHAVPQIWQQAVPQIYHCQQYHEFWQLPAPTARPTAASFDREVLELQSQNCIAAIMPCGWHDVGTPTAWRALSPLDWQAQCAAPKRVDRPWGYYYTHHVHTDRLLKNIYVYPGRRLSLQRHFHRSEHWRILQGTAHIILDGQSHALQSGEYITIHPGAWHRLANESNALLVIEEIQSGKPDEADIERAEDDYGRCLQKGDGFIACA